MRNTVHKRSFLPSTFQSFLLALIIDLLPALFFIQNVISYNDGLNDVDIEKTIFVLIVPIFNGVNFLLIVIMYMILSGRRLSWYIILMVPFSVFLLSYPALYSGAHIVDFFNLKFPKNEIFAFWIFTVSGWLISTSLGGIFISIYMLRQQAHAS
jgi:hypothetical protein